MYKEIFPKFNNKNRTTQFYKGKNTSMDIAQKTLFKCPTT